jgi:hypothetical protein
MDIQTSLKKARGLTHHAAAALGVGPAALAHLRVVLLAMKARRKHLGDGGECSVAKALSRSGSPGLILELMASGSLLQTTLIAPIGPPAPGTKCKNSHVERKARDWSHDVMHELS